MEPVRFILLHIHRTTDWSALDAIDYSLISFNALEAVFWFACAVHVALRNGRAHRSMQENAYAVLFAAFGLTDVVEVFQVSSPLIWVKLFILVPLFMLRQKVLAQYTPRPRLV